MKQINFNIPKIKEIINFFSSILKLRVVVFDRNYKVVVESNVCDCSYCRAIHQNPLLSRECIVSDKEAFNKSLTTKSLYSYKCHAGLNEAVINLHIDNEVVGKDIIAEYATIPSMEGLLTMFAGGLMEHVRNLSIGLNLYAEKLEEGGNN